MLKVLIISRYFPPFNEVGGFRAEGWVKYFPKYNISPTVITQCKDGAIDKFSGEYQHCKILKINYDGRDELIPNTTLTGFRWVRVFYRFLAYFSDKRLKKNLFYQAAAKELSHDNYDLLLVTAPPYYLIKIGSLLASDFNIPWVADTRDAWSTNLVSRSDRNIKNKIFSFLERRVVKSALFVTTVSPTNVPGIKSVNKGKRVEIVENGFFEEDFIDFDGFRSIASDTLKICYFGTLYDFQPVELFFEGLNTFYANTNGYSCEAYFLGTGQQKGATKRLDLLKEKLPCNLKVTQKLPRKEALKIGIESDVLLLLADRNTQLLPTKIYDYIALQRPIIVVRNDHSYIYELLKEYDKAFFCEDVNDVQRAIRKIITNDEVFVYNYKKVEEFGFTRRSLTGKMAQLIHDSL